VTAVVHCRACRPTSVGKQGAPHRWRHPCDSSGTRSPTKVRNDHLSFSIDRRAWGDGTQSVVIGARLGADEAPGHGPLSSDNRRRGRNRRDQRFATRSLAYQPLELANIAGLTTAAASRHCSGRCASP
jgi:hypothetical protein